MRFEDINENPSSMQVEHNHQGEKWHNAKAKFAHRSTT